MSKRQSLRGRGIDSLLFGISEKDDKVEERAKKKPKVHVKKVTNLKQEQKVETDFEIERITLPLKRGQLEALASLERSIMKRRSRRTKKQRITKNTIIRACLEVLLKLEFDTSEIPDEAELTRRINKAIT